MCRVVVMTEPTTAVFKDNNSVWRIEKITWWSEELDIWYRKNGYPEKIWKDNEGMPYGIAGVDDTNGETDFQWFPTVEERDKEFTETLNTNSEYVEEKPDE